MSGCGSIFNRSSGPQIRRSADLVVGCSDGELTRPTTRRQALAKRGDPMHGKGWCLPTCVCLAGILTLAGIPSAHAQQNIPPRTPPPAAPDDTANDTSPPTTTASSTSSGANPAASDEQLRAWIDELGADDFRVREHAAEQLRGLGVAAFDPLTAAMERPETEIRLRAEALRGELLVRRSQPTDPQAVQPVLQDYASQEVSERTDRIERLLEQGSAGACRALCRLARLEETERISKQAALAALSMSISDEVLAEGGFDASTMVAELGNSTRPSVEWLRRRFSGSTTDATAWQQLVDRERQAFVNGSADTQLEIVQLFTTWLVRWMIHQGQLDQVVPFLNDTYQRTGMSAELLVQVIDSLIEAKAWPTLDQLREAFSGEFKQSPDLMYRYAESWVLRGDRTRGEALAEEAFDQTDRMALARYETARNLEDRGLFDWAEREYRQFIRESGLKSRFGVVASYSLAEMLHDQNQELKAAEALQMLADEMDRDATVRQLIDDVGYLSVGSLMSRRCYFYAEHFRNQGDAEKQREYLQEGIVHDPTDADLLIARSRVKEAPEEFRKETERLIRSAIVQFRTEAATLLAQKNQMGAAGTYFDGQLAQRYNELAWLVANTEGDYQEALAASRKSLELMPDSAGYLDTLGRCYYAVGDLPQAIATQKQALRRDPHSGQLKRQLDQFEKELAQRQNAQSK